MYKRSASFEISSLVGFGFEWNSFSKAPRTDVSIDVRFLRRRPIVSGVVNGLLNVLAPKILNE